jgi:hypothetical protein
MRKIAAPFLVLALAACGAPQDIEPITETDRDRDVQGPVFNDGNTPAPPMELDAEPVEGFFVGQVGPATLSERAAVTASVFSEPGLFTDVTFFAVDEAAGEDAALLLFIDGALQPGDHFEVQSDAFSSQMVDGDRMILPRACADMNDDEGWFDYDEPPEDIVIDVDEGDEPGTIVLSFSMTDLEGGVSRGAMVLEH